MVPSEHRLVPGSGTAVVTAHGAVVIDTSGDSDVVDVFRLFLLSAQPVESLLKALLDVGLTAIPSFALVHRVDDRARLLVRGTATASIVPTGGAVRSFDAAGITLWREELVDLPCRIVLSSAPTEPPTGRWWMTSGVVPAVALDVFFETLNPLTSAEIPLAPSPDAPPAGEPVADLEPAGEEPLVDRFDGGPHDDPRATLIRRPTAQSRARPGPGATMDAEDPDHDGHTVIRGRSGRGAFPEERPPTGVEAIRCPSGHLNPPTHGLCRLCGEQIVDRAAVVTAPPLLGVLRFSDDRVVTLDRPVVIGRAPPPSAIDGCTPALVEIDDSTLSRFHAAVTTDGWDVFVTDQGSLNGTSVASPDGSTVLCEPYERTPLTVGAVVDLGGVVTFRFDAV
jgi:hypothetical protein